VNPAAIEAMAEVGIDIATRRGPVRLAPGLDDVLVSSRKPPPGRPLVRPRQTDV
jgi:hypothetical protein